MGGPAKSSKLRNNYSQTQSNTAKQSTPKIRRTKRDAPLPPESLLHQWVEVNEGEGPVGAQDTQEVVDAEHQAAHVVRNDIDPGHKKKSSESLVEKEKNSDDKNEDDDNDENYDDNDEDEDREIDEGDAGGEDEDEQFDDEYDNQDLRPDYEEYNIQSERYNEAEDSDVDDIKTLRLPHKMPHRKQLATRAYTARTHNKLVARKSNVARQTNPKTKPKNADHQKPRQHLRFKPDKHDWLEKELHLIEQESQSLSKKAYVLNHRIKGAYTHQKLKPNNRKELRLVPNGDQTVQTLQKNKHGSVVTSNKHINVNRMNENKSNASEIEKEIGHASNASHSKTVAKVKVTLTASEKLIRRLAAMERDLSELKAELRARNTFDGSRYRVRSPLLMVAEDGGVAEDEAGVTKGTQPNTTRRPELGDRLVEGPYNLDTGELNELEEGEGDTGFNADDITPDVDIGHLLKRNIRSANFGNTRIANMKSRSTRDKSATTKKQLFREKRYKKRAMFVGATSENKIPKPDNVKHSKSIPSDEFLIHQSTKTTINTETHDGTRNDTHPNVNQLNVSDQSKSKIHLLLDEKHFTGAIDDMSKTNELGANKSKARDEKYRITKLNQYPTEGASIGAHPLISLQGNGIKPRAGNETSQVNSEQQSRRKNKNPIYEKIYEEEIAKNPLPSYPRSFLAGAVGTLNKTSTIQASRVMAGALVKINRVMNNLDRAAPSRPPSRPPSPRELTHAQRGLDYKADTTSRLSRGGGGLGRSGTFPVRFRQQSQNASSFPEDAVAILLPIDGGLLPPRRRNFQKIRSYGKSTKVGSRHRSEFPGRSNVQRLNRLILWSLYQARMKHGLDKLDDARVMALSTRTKLKTADSFETFLDDLTRRLVACRVKAKLLAMRLSDAYGRFGQGVDTGVGWLGAEDTDTSQTHDHPFDQNNIFNKKQFRFKGSVSNQREGIPYDITNHERSNRNDDHNQDAPSETRDAAVGPLLPGELQSSRGTASKVVDMMMHPTSVTQHNVMTSQTRPKRLSPWPISDNPRDPNEVDPVTDKEIAQKAELMQLLARLPASATDKMAALELQKEDEQNSDSHADVEEAILHLQEAEDAEWSTQSRKRRETNKSTNLKSHHKDHFAAMELKNNFGSTQLDTMMKNDDSDYADINVFLMTNKAKTEDIQPDVDTGIGTLRKRAAKNDQYHYFDNEEKELMDGNSDVDSVDLSEGSEYDIDDDDDDDDDEKTDADQSDDEADREVQASRVRVTQGGRDVKEEEEVALQPASKVKKPTQAPATWGAWSACSTTCGVGQRFRSNVCEDGQPCQGKDASTEVEVCVVRDEC